MKPSKVYRKAAENIANGTTLSFMSESCVEISKIQDGEWKPENELVADYERIFKPDGSTNIWGWNWGVSFCEINDCRVLALLFMSEIAKDSK